MISNYIIQTKIFYNILLFFIDFSLVDFFGGVISISNNDNKSNRNKYLLLLLIKTRKVLFFIQNGQNFHACL